MEGLGLDLHQDFEAIYLTAPDDGPAMIIDGRAAALWGGGYRWPGFVTVANSPRGARFVVPDSGEIGRIRAKHSFLRRLTVPSGL